MGAESGVLDEFIFIVFISSSITFGDVTTSRISTFLVVNGVSAMNLLMGALTALDRFVDNDLWTLSFAEVDLRPDLERGLGVTGNYKSRLVAAME